MKSIALLTLRTSFLPKKVSFSTKGQEKERLILNPVRAQKNKLQYVTSISQLLEAVSYSPLFTIFN